MPSLSWPRLKSAAANVIPRRHQHAPVDRYRAPRRMRQHHAHTQRIHDIQLGYQGLEVVAIGTQAVQPDDAGTRRQHGIDFNGIEQGDVHTT